ncbi:unnamed protein product [Camellia sinensis]
MIPFNRLGSQMKIFYKSISNGSRHFTYLNITIKYTFYFAYQRFHVSAPTMLFILAIHPNTINFIECHVSNKDGGK